MKNFNENKWEHCKAVGMKPDEFIERMQWKIDGAIKEMNSSAERAKEEKDESRLEWLLGGVEYYGRKAKRLKKEVEKARKEIR